MIIHFIGVAGGRVATARSIKGHGPGGFRRHTSLNMHVDHCPGAAVKCSLLGINIEKTDVLLVTHNHLDHVNDINVFAEAMNGYGFKKKGILVASRAVLEGPDTMLTNYHKKMFRQIVLGESGKSVDIKDIEIYFTPIDHSETTGFGFVLKAEGKSIGYTSDTLYFSELPSYFKNVDVLIANITKPYPDKYNVHMSLFPDGVELFKRARPKLGVVYHTGMKMIFSKKRELIQKASEECGVRLIIPNEGYVLKLDQ